jgi:hypothetical protein
MKTARALLITIFGLALAGCESTNSTGPESMSLQPRTTSAVVGDVVYLRTYVGLADGTIILVKSYTAAEPFTCGETTFTGTISGVIPSVTMGAETFEVSAPLEPGTKLRVSGTQTTVCAGKYTQATVVE